MSRVPLWVVLLVGIAWGLAIGHVVRVYDARRVQAQGIVAHHPPLR